MEDYENANEERTSTFKMTKRQNKRASSTFLEKYEPDSKYTPSNFEILKDSIGQGAFSEVKKCRNIVDNKNYAVKIISKSILKENGVDFSIVYNEISIQQRIIHPNIVRLYSYSEDEDNFYLYLELVEGTTLYSKIKGGLSEKETNLIFNQIAQAIAFLHRNKLVHRDIKLENFLISKTNNTIKLCDFGWCVQLTKEEPKRMTVCGTYDYMSPEMINDEPYNTSIDIWALGVLLYEMLHGYSPFGNNNDDDYSTTFKNVMTYKFKIVKEISNNCKDLLLKLLAFNYKERIDIEGVLKHPWMKDWNDNTVNINFDNNDSNNIENDNLYDDILNNVEKLNKKGNKKKKKKVVKTTKKITYKKYSDSYYKENLSEDNDNNDNNTIISQKENTSNVQLSQINREEQLSNNINTQPEITEIKKEENVYTKTNNNNKKNMNLEEEEIIPNKNKNKENTKKNLRHILKKKQDTLEEEYSTDKLLNILDIEESKQKNYKLKQSNNYNINEEELNKEYEKKKKIKKLEDELYDLSKANENFDKKNNELLDALEIFEKAKELNKNTKNKEKAKPGFWSKLFENFKCGSND